MSTGLPLNVEAFIRDHIDSVTLLDALCVFARDPDREWSSEMIASELRSNPKAIRESMQVLFQKKVLSEGKEPGHFMLRGNDPALVELVKEVCYYFKTFHSRMIELVYSDRKNQKLRTFADAFRITPKGDRGNS